LACSFQQLGVMKWMLNKKEKEKRNGC